MGRGFFAGIIWGSVVGLVIITVASQLMERRDLRLPVPETTEVDVPAGTEFDQARPEEEPVVPRTEAAPSGEPASVAATPSPDLVVEQPPLPDTAPAAPPTPATAAVTAPEAPQTAEAAGVAVQSDQPVADPAATIVPSVPGTDQPLSSGLDAPARPVEKPAEATVETAEPEPEPAPAPAPAIAETPPAESAPAAPAPAQADAAADPPPAEPAAPQPSETATADPPADDPGADPVAGAGMAPVEAPADESAAETAPDTPASEPEAAPAEVATSPRIETRPPVRRIGAAEGGIGNLAPDVTTDRLPSIGRQAQPDEDTAATADPAPGGGGALVVNAAAFDNPGNRPLLAVVLVHDPSGGVAQSALEALPFPVSFAVDAGAENAAEIAARYRAAGQEVVMIPSLPAGATPSDVEVALQINLETIPNAVAVMDAAGGSFQSDRVAVAQVIEVLASTGHGLVTMPRGLNTAQQLAERDGVPSGMIFRDIDGAGQDAAAVRRFLDQAAFRARQEEVVILVGRTREATISALLEWALGNRAASVTMAPVSAALWVR